MHNLDLKIASQSRAAQDRDRRGFALCGFGFLPAILLALAAAGAAQAQSSGTAPARLGPASTTDDSLTWHGITLYGIVDIGLQYDNHMAPISDYYPAGSGDVVQKNSNGSVTGVTPNNLSQSRVGLQGKEALPFMDWSAVFKLETFFNPQSGEISDALKSAGPEQRQAAGIAKHEHRLERGGPGIPAVVRGDQFADLRHVHLRPPKHAVRGRHLQV